MSEVIKKARDAKKEDVAQKFKNNVVPLIDKDKKTQLLLALRDLIRADTTIDNENRNNFELYSGMSKKDALVQCGLDNKTSVLPSVLAGVFLYTVIAVKNKVGKECIKFIDEYISRYSGNYIKLNTNAERGPLPQIDTLPFVRNKYFSGRSDLLKQIRDKFAAGNTDTHTTQVIFGLDGMGKTQIALEYAHGALVLEEYDAICWIDCANEDAVKKSCCYFLSKIGETAVLEDISRVTLWLQTNSKWLLVLDDVNDDVLIERLVPKRGKGHILVTTQQKKILLSRLLQLK